MIINIPSLSKKILTDSAIPTELNGMMIASNMPAIRTKSVFSGLKYTELEGDKNERISRPWNMKYEVG